MTSAAAIPALAAGGTFLAAWAVVSLLVLAVAFVIMLRATYVEWKEGTLW